VYAKTDVWKRLSSVNVRFCPQQSVIAANGVLLLLESTCYFLDRQIARLAADFEKEGGFTERLYRVRSKERNK
jgi:four helix bundle suffix protein